MKFSDLKIETWFRFPSDFHYFLKIADDTYRPLGSTVERICDPNKYVNVAPDTVYTYCGFLIP